MYAIIMIDSNLDIKEINHIYEYHSNNILKLNFVFIYYLVLRTTCQYNKTNKHSWI